jgi:hypothetical protein
MKIEKEILDEMIAVICQAAEFVERGTPIHPGSEVAQNILQLKCFLNPKERWNCSQCGEPHNSKPKLCNYCGTKPEDA